MSYRDVKSKDESFSEVVKRIKKLRELNNESQEELAKAVNMTKYTIANIEQGKTNLSLETAMLIAGHYHVSVDYICGMGNDMTVANDVLDTLCRYVMISTRTMHMRQAHKVPFLSINKSLFDYLNVLDKAEQFKKDNVADELISAWLEKEKEKTLHLFQRESKDSFVEYALLSQRDIASDEVMELLENTYRDSSGDIKKSP